MSPQVFRHRSRRMAVAKSIQWWEVVAPICLLVTWILAVEFGKQKQVMTRLTENQIRRNDQLVQSFVRTYNEVPRSFLELRLFAIVSKKNLETHDAWGSRLEYLRLGRINYTIRSFGADGTQNTLDTDLDPGVFRWGQLIAKGLQYDFQSKNESERPSVVLFAGLDDVDRRWHAKLFLDPKDGTRQLLVRSRVKQNLYMLAPHDGIEEFLFLPEGQKIIFTASGSKRYKDGLWIWDLVTDQCFNVLEFTSYFGGLSVSKQERPLALALGAIVRDPDLKTFTVSSYIADRRGSSVKLEDFFSTKYLHKFVFFDGVLKDHVMPNVDSPNQKVLFDMDWIYDSTVLQKGEGASVQKAWQNLPRDGDYEVAMEKWQQFTTTYSNVALTPYAVLAQALFLSDAAKHSGTSQEARVLKGFSVELFNALPRMVSAPQWMREIDW